MAKSASMKSKILMRGLLALRHLSEIASDRSDVRSSILMEHDLFGKPVSTLGSNPRADFFQLMLQGGLPSDHQWLRARETGGAPGERYCVLALQKPPLPLKAAWHC